MLISYYKTEIGTYEHKIGNFSEKEISHYVYILNIIQLVLSGLIVLEFMIRKIPSILQIINEKSKETEIINLSAFKRKQFFLKEFIQRSFLNLEVMYYSGYFIFSYMGITNDLYFSLLLTEIIMRYKTLKNVLMSIRNPFKELMLTLFFWFIMTYILTILGYSTLFEYFPSPSNSNCENLAKCWSYIFYQNNKVSFLFI